MPKPPQLISISRRTDIPAFYGDWFMQRVASGFVGWENPFAKQHQLVSLQRADVRCLAFWSKNFRPFLPHLRTLQDLGYPCFFNYTITGLPSLFEPRVVPTDDAVDSLHELARLFSPDHINWRYDPIILSEQTLQDYHLTRFAELAAALRGHVNRCIISFVWRYRKVERNFATLERAQQLRILDPEVATRRQLAEQLAVIAANHGLTLHTCCGDNLLSNRIHKAHCLDGETISRIYYDHLWRPAAHPTRPECGCATNVDIGRYDTCPHGCIYCYANANKSHADTCHQTQDPAAAILGYSQAEADRCIAACRD